MIFKSKNIEYKDVIENNFTFTKINLSKETLDFFESILFVENEISSKDCTFKSKDKLSYEVPQIAKIVDSLPIDETLRNEIRSFEFTVDKYCLGDSMGMHTDEGRVFPYEILIYYPKKEEFSGRELHILGPDYDFKFKPKIGSVCFVNTFLKNNKVYHGVTELKTDTEIYVLIGGVGLDSKKYQEYFNI